MTEQALQQRSIITEMAHRFGMERQTFEATIKKTIMPAGQDVSNEQLTAFMVVAREYDLNPFTKEIFAFPARGGGIQPIVSIDGWLKIINKHPQYNGMVIQDAFEGGQLVSTTCTMHRKDRDFPTVITEYLTECERNTEQWKQKKVRMMHHKAVIQTARYAFGFSGIVDPDEGERMIEMGAIEVVPPSAQATLEKIGKLREELREKLRPDAPGGLDVEPMMEAADEQEGPAKK